MPAALTPSKPLHVHDEFTETETRLPKLVRLMMSVSAMEPHMGRSVIETQENCTCCPGMRKTKCQIGGRVSRDKGLRNVSTSQE